MSDTEETKDTGDGGENNERRDEEREDGKQSQESENNDRNEREEKEEQGQTAKVLKGLSGQLLDEKMKDSLDLVDITFTCKVCSMKAKSLQELMGHMKDGQCTTKRRPRGRPRKVVLPNQEKPPPKPAAPIVVQPTERITRVKSGAIKRKSVADLFIKQEPASSDEDYHEGVPKRRRKRIDVVDLDAEEFISESPEKTEKLSGTQALAANKDAQLSGHEVRIPIGSLRDGESKIIKLNTTTEESPQELSGSVLQIREVDSKPIVEVLSEAHETLDKASATIYLRTGARRSGDEDEEQVLEGTEENVQYVEMHPQELMHEINEGADNVSEEDSQDLTELQTVQFVQPQEQDQNVTIKTEPKKRRYTKLPSALESDVLTMEKTAKKPTFSTKCKKCVQRWFQSQEELDIHYRLHDQWTDGYQCDKCDYKCTHWGRMQYHLVKHPEYCEQLRGMHMMKNIFGSFKCPECGKMFEFKSNLSNHFAKMHNRDSKFCPNCSQVFDNMDEKKFERHVDRCKGQELYCDFCPYTTSIRSNMRIHLRVHSGQGLSCDICHKVFPTKQRQEVHRQKHLKDRQRFPCEHCGADFCSKDAVKKHVARMHTEKEVLYKCSMCAYTTKHETDFKKHVKCVHEKKFNCHVQDCNYGTNRMDQLTLHSEYHNPDRVFKCSYTDCYTAFSSQRNLLSHMQGVHKIGCKHQCPICLKYFKKKTVLLRHLVSHTTERPYSCHECGESFTCHSTYYRHRNRTGHDARREGVASVPQNITIQYIDANPGAEVVGVTSTTGGDSGGGVGGGEETDKTGNPADVTLTAVTVIDQKVLQEQGLPTNEASNSLINVSDASEVITLDATQFAQLQQQQQQQQQQQEQPIATTINDANVTYYVYEAEGEKLVLDGGTQQEQNDMVMESQLENGEKQTLEAIPLDENNDIRSEIEDYNSQFINLDLPNGPAFVKVDENGALMVMNSLGHPLETEEIVAETAPELSQKNNILNLDPATAVTVVQNVNTVEEHVSTAVAQNVVENMSTIAQNVVQNVDMSDMPQEQEAEVVYQEMSTSNDVPKEQYVFYTTNGDGTVVEGESAAAYSMLQLQGGKVDGADLQELQ